MRGTNKKNTLRLEKYLNQLLMESKTNSTSGSGWLGAVSLMSKGNSNRN